jgi:tetratricopeptide (TPR) repeat protein
MITTSRQLAAAALSVVFLGGPTALLAQSADVDAVKGVIQAETETYYRRDAEGWKATWIQDSSAIRTFITSGSYSAALGWNNFGPGTVESIRTTAPEAVRIDRSNYVVQIDGALAWAEYDERTNYSSGAPPLLARQQRTLVKRSGEWKILSAGSFVSSTYGTEPRAVEGRLDQLGRDLSAAKKHHDALEVLKLSAQLFPASPRVHQSLGEAYAAAGETGLAIRSFEKSIAIDPKNEAGRAALAKLRERKSP